jgi:LysR family hydrogen peroxide-inducible transcriptional activator
MNLNALRYIVAVAQERNFRRAAERCFVSQPALSLAVQKLEDELGVALFERSRTEVSVTSIGELIVEQAQRALEEIGRIKEIARQGQDQLIGPLRLGVIYTVGPYLLPELIPVLHRKAPQMPLEVEENITANLDTLLRNGKLDVIVIALPFGTPGIATEPLYDEPFEVVVPAEHPWGGRTSIKAKELTRERVLLLNVGHCFSNQVVEACPELTTKGGDTQQGNSLETIRNMVASGLGVTVLPCTANAAKYRSKLLRVVPFAAPAPARRIALAWRKSFGREKAIETLAAAVRSLRLPGVEMVGRTAR